MLIHVLAPSLFNSSPNGIWERYCRRNSASHPARTLRNEVAKTNALPMEFGNERCCRKYEGIRLLLWKRQGICHSKKGASARM